jgi:hypothetical protein
VNNFSATGISWREQLPFDEMMMVSVLASSAVDHGFDPRSGQTTDYKIGICCFTAKHAVLRS